MPTKHNRTVRREAVYLRNRKSPDMPPSKITGQNGRRTETPYRKEAHTVDEISRISLCAAEESGTSELMTAITYGCSP